MKPEPAYALAPASDALMARAQEIKERGWALALSPTAQAQVALRERLQATGNGYDWRWPR